LLRVDEEEGGVGRHREVDEKRDHGEEEEQHHPGPEPSNDIAETRRHQPAPVGSKARRSSSPSWFSASTVRKIARLGTTVSQGWKVDALYRIGLSTVPQAAPSMLPQLEVGRCTPTPRNVIPASSMMFVASISVAKTSSGATRCGKRCLRMMRMSPAPVIAA